MLPIKLFNTLLVFALGSILEVHLTERIRLHTPPIQRLSLGKTVHVETKVTVGAAALHLLEADAEEVPLAVSLRVGVHPNVQIILIIPRLSPLYDHAVPLSRS